VVQRRAPAEESVAFIERKAQALVTEWNDEGAAVEIVESETEELNVGI
jgi:hypothetical protein